MPPLASSIVDDLQQTAAELGFPLFGVVSAQDAPGFDRFCDWLERGYAGSMAYLDRRRAAYQHPSSVLPNVKTIVMLGMPYQPANSLRKKDDQEPPPSNISAEPVSGTALAAGSSIDVSNRPRLASTAHKYTGIDTCSVALTPNQGQVAAYASGTRDYHDVIHERLKRLASWFIERNPNAQVRSVVDTAPLLEREFASMAGLGWIGKNTLLLNRNAGSYFFLAAMLTDIAIDHQLAINSDHCGTCTACLDACPTDAFPTPHVLDASRCISYLTIEHRGAIPVELRESIGSWVFGCDVCQQVCPWNRMAKPTNEIAFQRQPSIESLDLTELLELDDEAFRLRYRKTPLWRTRRVGMQRNALIALGNQRNQASLPILTMHLSSDDEILRCTAAWAIGQIGSDAAKTTLQEQLRRETIEEVRHEIIDALEFMQN
ncbi:MAG: tRNA epoxyqueuosine(34) reductase QueG [Pirellulaceae bacterium]|nr:tRNA epoxyqueuosine(34) reductase QueG [Pirellulaceae bacterium]